MVIVIILAVATALVWFKPELFSSISLSSLSSLNPFASKRDVTASNDIATVEIPISTESGQNGIFSDSNELKSNTIEDTVPEMEVEPEPEPEETLTPFERDVKQRHESYQTKIYTYQPYEPPVLRNPFQRVVGTVYVGEAEEEKLAKELSTVEDIRRFVTPELPIGTKFSGLICSGNTRLAIIELEDDTYIAKEGDLIEDRYLVKSIQDDRVIIEINGYEIAQKLGGEEDSNE